MNSEKGITLVSLIIYILMFSMIIGLLAGFSSYIYGNLDQINSDSFSSEEFNKFNVNFIKDVKNNRNANINISGNNKKIIFADGTNYDYISSEKSIYRNKVKIAVNIFDFSVTKEQINNKNVLKVIIGTGKNENDFGKTINYVLKYW